MGADVRLVACPFGAGVLLLFRRGSTLEPTPLPGSVIPPHDGSGPLHMAFAIGAEGLEARADRLARHGVAAENRVAWPRGGTSLYFRDPDGHALELATPGLWRNYRAGTVDVRGAGTGRHRLRSDVPTDCRTSRNGFLHVLVAGLDTAP